MTVLSTKEKPTRPPPRKLKVITEPPVTSSQVKTTAAENTTMMTTMTTTTTTMTATTTTMTSTALKLKWKSFDRKMRKKNKLKQRKKSKKRRGRKGRRGKKMTDRDQVTLHSNYTGTDNLNINALDAPINLKDDTDLTKKKKGHRRKGARRQTKHEMGSKEPVNDSNASMNETMTDLRKPRRYGQSTDDFYDFI